MTSLPSNLTEADVLDFVEGGDISPQVLARIEAALVADPAFEALVQGMRSDRAPLMALAAAKAPVGLLESVEALLENEDLASVVGVEHAASGPVPVVVLRSQTPGVLARIGPARTLAAAAACAFVAGAAWLTLGPASNSASRLIALDSRTARDLAATQPHNEGVRVATEAPQLARSDSPTAARGSSLNAHALEVSSSGPDDAAGAAADSVALAESTAQFVGPVPPDQNADASAQSQPWGMSLARAAELAREGRLIIEVRSTETDRTQLRLDGLARRPTGAVRVAQQPDASIASQTASYVRQQVGLAHAQRQSAQQGFGDPVPGDMARARAGESGGVPAAPLPQVPGSVPQIALQPVPPPRVLEQGYEAMVMPDERSIRSLLRVLTPGSMQVAQLIEIDAPVAAQIQQTRVQQQAGALPTTGAPAPPSRAAKEQTRPEPPAPVAVPIVVREK
ncbi:MAG: hypothetical protein ACKVS8_10205 [Phycisphaerales bacterium]